MEIVAKQDLEGFCTFTSEVFGATTSIRNKGDNILVSLPSGIMVGTLNGLFYTFTGDKDLVKTVLGMWQEGLNHLQGVQALAQQTNEKENGNAV